MRLPLLFDADLVTFLDRAYSAASIAAPGVAVHERIANLRHALLLELFRLCEVVVPRDVNASARCARPACAAARQLDELSADALRRRRAAAPLSLVSRYRRSQRKAPRNYRRIAALVAPCTFAHFADQMAGTDES